MKIISLLILSKVLHLSRNPGNDQCLLHGNEVSHQYFGLVFTSCRRQDEEMNNQKGKAIVRAVMRA